MTINGGTAWAAAVQSYGKGSVQDQSGASQSASTDYTSMLQQATDMLLSSLDSDKSGTIDKTEFSQAAQALSEKTGKTYNDASSVFGSIDSNSDGAISADELMKALQQSQGKQQAHGGHHRPKPDVLDTTAQNATSDTTQKTSEESSLSKIQMALLARVMAAYSTDNAASSSKTLATA